MSQALDSFTALPPLARAWVHAALEEGTELPRERRADCGACPMVPERAQAEDAFLRDVRCCTYEPVLANFQVGAFFRDDRPGLERGRRRLAARITERAGVTPLGVDRPPSYPLWLAADEERFGKDETLACGYLDASDEHARCTVHAARNAVCATWFCKHERGTRGGRFWLAVRHLLAALEEALAHHCLRELDVPGDALLALAVAQDRPFEPPSPALYQRLWGDHRFREGRFYAACHEIVEGLDGRTALALGGARAERHARALRAAARDLVTETLPSAVVLGAAEVVARRDGKVALHTYRRSDPLTLTEAELQEASACDGATAAAAAERLGRARLRVLLDYEVLVGAPDGSPR